MKVGMIQSNYIPWRGYFDFIDDVNLFIFYDDVQYTMRDWRNRNKIKTDKDLLWLTVPVVNSQNDVINIEDAKIDYTQRWAVKHINSIKQAYCKAPYFKDYFEQLSEILHVNHNNISELNISLIKWLMKQLNVNTKLKMSREFNPVGSKTERIIDILIKAKADTYLVGPAAKNYIEVEKFKDAGIGLEYKAYEYETYPQLYNKFEPQVSVLDLLFNCGGESRKYLKSLSTNEKTC